MKTKYCPICKQFKHFDEFPNATTSKDGKFTYCKLCSNQKSKDYIQNHKKERSIYNKKYSKFKAENFPEKNILSGIQQRCTNPKNKRFKDYGGRGIKCLITVEEIKELMIRDNYYNFKRPSIDRKNNDGDYTFDNCQFLEFDENSAKDKRKPILQYDLNNNLIKEFISTKDAENKTGFSHKCIGRVALGQRKMAYGYVWKYKEIK
jgi:hypothetical protein